MLIVAGLVTCSFLNNQMHLCKITVYAFCVVIEPTLRNAVITCIHFNAIRTVLEDKYHYLMRFGYMFELYNKIYVNSWNLITLTIAAV